MFRLFVLFVQHLYICDPSLQTTEEGSTVSCVIERMRGSLDYVYVHYNVTQLDSSNNKTPAYQDLVNATGAVLFKPGQRSEVCGQYMSVK